MTRGPASYEVPKDWAPSGNAYVAVRPRDVSDVSKVRILKSTTCDHVANVCSECKGMWEWDYEIFYDRTAGGRALKS